MEDLRAEFKVADRDIVLFSGGIDSLYTSILLRKKNPLLLFVDMGAKDIYWSKYFAGKVAEKIGCEFKVDNSIINIGREHCYGHNLYIPRRNLFLGLIGAMYGKRVYLAGVKGDVSPDKSPEVMKIMFNAINETGHKSEAIEFFDSILWDIDKVAIVGDILEKGYSEDLLKLSYSCYKGMQKPCGECISCFRKWAALTLNNVDTKRYFKKFPLETKAAKYYTDMILKDKYQENIPLPLMKKLLGL